MSLKIIMEAAPAERAPKWVVKGFIDDAGVEESFCIEATDFAVKQRGWEGVFGEVYSKVSYLKKKF